jgi:DNA-binding response OmpR family regulator
VSEAKPKILIVEDEMELVEAIRDFFQRNDYKVRWVLRAQEAISILDRERFDCILLDMRLAQDSGEKVVDHIRNPDHKVNAQTPIVVMSGALDEAMVRRIARNVNGMVVKPFEMRDLLSRVQPLCKKT